ncbi:MAG: hypothetical protein IJG87_03875 [Ruminococcus sp.]|nr:hypothetical protein [Ruminococcus sp.]
MKEYKNNFLQDFGDLLRDYSREKVDYIDYDEELEEVSIGMKGGGEINCGVDGMDILDIVDMLVDILREAREC